MRRCALTACWRRPLLVATLLATVTGSAPDVAGAEPGAVDAPGGEAIAPAPEAAEEDRYTTSEDQFWRGFNYLYGRGVEKDPVESVVWFRRAAEQGYARAQVHMGMAYLKGRGVARDPTQATEWLTLAAEQNHSKAQLELGLAYFQGIGVPRDRILGLKWLTLAVQSGGIVARTNASRLMNQATPQQRTEAQTLVREWRVAHGLPVPDIPEAEDAGNGS